METKQEIIDKLKLCICFNDNGVNRYSKKQTLYWKEREKLNVEQWEKINGYKTTGSSEYYLKEGREKTDRYYQLCKEGEGKPQIIEKDYYNQINKIIPTFKFIDIIKLI